MATDTFERKIEIDPEKLEMVMNMDVSKDRLSSHPFTSAERERSEKLLKKFLSKANL